jgi:hypothetical protein
LSFMDLLGSGHSLSMFVCLQVDPSDLHYSSSEAVVILLRWSYGALAR